MYMTKGHGALCSYITIREYLQNVFWIFQQNVPWMLRLRLNRNTFHLFISTGWHMGQLPKQWFCDPVARRYSFAYCLFSGASQKPFYRIHFFYNDWTTFYHYFVSELHISPQNSWIYRISPHIRRPSYFSNDKFRKKKVFWIKLNA
jgi:hypothetical protein